MAEPSGVECIHKALEQLFEGFRKTTEWTVKTQQDLFREWTTLWTGVAKIPQPATREAQEARDTWARKMEELTRQQQETWGRQYKAAMASLEDALKTTEGKDRAELRREMTELCQKSFDCWKDLMQAQMKNVQTAVQKWMDLAKKASP